MKIIIMIVIGLSITNSMVYASTYYPSPEAERRNIFYGEMQGRLKFEINQPIPNQQKIDVLKYLVLQGDSIADLDFTLAKENFLRNQIPEDSAYQSYQAYLISTSTIGGAEKKETKSNFWVFNGFIGGIIGGITFLIIAIYIIFFLK